jgi:hypothetical protein
VIENRVQAIVFGPERGDITEEWRNCKFKNFVVLFLLWYYCCDEGLSIWDLSLS